MKNLILTIQFLTRIPIPIKVDIKEDSFAKGIIYFPVVGLIIGVINAAVFYLTSYFLGGHLPIVLALLSNTLVTGAFHLDGIADTCDGLYSARKKDQMLEIMKDSRIGTNGMIAILFDILLRIAILSNMDMNLSIIALILAPIAAKINVVLLYYISKYAREKGLGGLYFGKVKRVSVVVSILVGIILFYYVLKLRGVIIFLLLIGVSLVFKKHVYSKIDGMTGDTMGAVNEIIEIMCMLLILLSSTLSIPFIKNI